MEPKEIKNAAGGNEVSITRIVNAPRELVYACWTDAEHLKRWYFPNNCTVHFTYVDVKIDGGIHGAIIHKDDGKHNWFKAVFHEIVPPERLAFTLARADEKGNFITPAEAGMPHEWPERTVVTLTFEELGKQTRFTLHQTVDLELATRTGAYPSWLQMLDRMESLIIK